jgi:hypothetical protein
MTVSVRRGAVKLFPIIELNLTGRFQHNRKPAKLSAMKIEVKQSGYSEPRLFTVRIIEGSGETRHQVTMSNSDYQNVTAGRFSAEELIDAAFRFLLDREPKEAILGQFDLMTIPRYFPDFEARMPDYLGKP